MWDYIPGCDIVTNFSSKFNIAKVKNTRMIIEGITNLTLTEIVVTKPIKLPPQQD